MFCSKTKMNYNNEDNFKPPKVRLRLDPKEQFPEKLYDVANDGYLVKWDGCGTAVQVEDPELFEKDVMKCYPGFLQIPSFVNFRRLFREYSFSWRLVDDEQTFEFSHPSFVYGHREALSEIRTKRKSFSKPIFNFSTFHRDVMALDDEDDEEDGRRYRTRRSRLTKRRSLEDTQPQIHNQYSNDSKFVINDSIQETENSNDNVKLNQREVTKAASGIQCQTQFNSKNNTFNSVASEIMKLFIKNEFTFEDFCAWAERNQTDFTVNVGKWDVIETMSSQMDRNQSYAESYVSGTTDEYLSNSQNSVPNNSSQTDPCGYCGCCMAYQRFNENSVYDSDSSVFSMEVSNSPSAPGEYELSCDQAFVCDL